MADSLRVTVLRRDLSPFVGARCSLHDPAATPTLQPTDAKGQVLYAMNGAGTFTLLVTHAEPKGQAVISPAWEQNLTAFWPVEIAVTYAPTGKLRFTTDFPLEVTARTETSMGSSTLCDLEVRLYRVRLMDSVVKKVMARFKLGGVPMSYPGVPPGYVDPFMTSTTSPLLDGSDRVARVPFTGNRHNGEAAMFELALRKEPSGAEEHGGNHLKCVGVYSPDEIDADEPDVLLYFRPQPAQDFDPSWESPYTTLDDKAAPKLSTAEYQLNRFDKDPYSKGVYHFDWFFRRTFEHVIDPFVPNQEFAKGFINQIEASDKKVVVIAPVPEVTLTSGGYGRGVEPSYMDEVVGEVLSFMEVLDTQNWMERPPAETGPIRSAVACFSNGADPAATYLNAARGAPSTNRMATMLREVYAFDPPATYSARLLDAALHLIDSHGKPDEHALRIYVRDEGTLSPFAALHKLLSPGPATVPLAPYDATAERLPAGTTPPKIPSPLNSAVAPALAHATAAYLPSAAWPKPMKGLQIHSAIPGTMLTHALRLSAFTKR